MNLSKAQQQAICAAAGYQKIVATTAMQSLWAGQGQLARLTLAEPSSAKAEPQTEQCSLVVKQIVYAPAGNHPRGWNTSLSEQRKRQSYLVELDWYRQFAEHISKAAAVPQLLYSEAADHGLLLVMEDLAIDYPVRFTAGKDDRPSQNQIKACIHWLAQLHGKTLTVRQQGNAQDSSGLWPVGGYWHLATRPDEWQAMAENSAQQRALKQAAQALDQQLANCPYQALIHGDAKLANFCFASSGNKVAAVDFQYVGQGPGVKDLMLLLSSVMPDERLLREADALLEHYFTQLRAALAKWQPELDAQVVITAWQPLYAVAWADFHRFLSGWSPGHWKIGDYCQRQTDLALASLATGSGSS